MHRSTTVIKKCLATAPAVSLVLALLAPLDSSHASARILGPYFNHDEASSYTDPYRGLQRQGTDLEAIILAEIESATTSIDMAIQELRLPKIAHALVRKQHQGVRVRLVVENQYNFTISELDQGRAQFDRSQIGPRNDHSLKRVKEYVRFVDLNADGILSDYEISQRDAMAILNQSHIPLIDDTADGSKGGSLMHHKFLVVDGKRLVVTSANFTMSDIHGDYSSLSSRGNANALLVFEEPSLIKAYTKEFEILWGSKELRPGRSLFGVQKPYRGTMRTSSAPEEGLSVQFSPTPRGLGFSASTNGLIDRSLARSQKTVDLALFVFSEQRFADTLQKLSQRFPLSIRVLVEPAFAFQWFSEALDLMGLQLLGPTCKPDVANNPWAQGIQSVGMPNLDSGDFLHHKFAVIDSKTTIFGSQNWSHAANVSNDENLLVIEDAKVAQKFSNEFQRLYRSSRLGASSTLKRKIYFRNAACGKAH